MSKHTEVYAKAARDVWRVTSQTIFGTNDWIPPQRLMRMPLSCDEHSYADPTGKVDSTLNVKRLGLLLAFRDTI